jgi:hypothetical protein
MEWAVLKLILPQTEIVLNVVVFPFWNLLNHGAHNRKTMDAHTQVRLCERLYDMSRTVGLFLPKAGDAGLLRLYLNKVSANNALKRTRSLLSAV